MVPAEIPKICVCTAPATPTVHESELPPESEGEIAEGGGDLSVVVTEPVVCTVELVVLSVTIGSATANTGSNRASHSSLRIMLPVLQYEPIAPEL